jgi:hypothetical protein
MYSMLELQLDDFTAQGCHFVCGARHGLKNVVEPMRFQHRFFIPQHAVASFAV